MAEPAAMRERRHRNARDPVAECRTRSVAPASDAGTHPMSEAVEASDVDTLVEHLYLELRALARSVRRRGGAPDTLHTTALVNELYLRLADAERLRFGEPRQFFAYAAQAMRHLLLDRAKLQMRIKRENPALRVALADPEVDAIPVDPALALELDAALDALLAQDARAAEVVNLHFFAGLPLPQVAGLLGLSLRTVARDWRFATAFLKARVS